jgi:hypothetical protein
LSRQTNAPVAAAAKQSKSPTAIPRRCRRRGAGLSGGTNKPDSTAISWVESSAESSAGRF